MTKVEVIHFMEKIKAYYSNFSMEDYVVNESYDKLKQYDVDDVYQKLDEHLDGNLKSDIPKLHFITRFLKTPTEKKRDQVVYTRCKECGKKISIDNYSNHVGRHNSIYYMKSKEGMIKKNYNIQKLFEADQVTFDKVYDNFIERLYEVLPESPEKERLKNIVLIKYGYEPEFNLKELMRKI